MSDGYVRWSVQAKLLPGSGKVRQVEFRAVNGMFGEIGPVILHVDHRAGMEEEDLRLFAIQLALATLTGLAAEMRSQLPGAPPT